MSQDTCDKALKNSLSVAKLSSWARTLVNMLFVSKDTCDQTLINSLSVENFSN